MAKQIGPSQRMPGGRQTGFGGLGEQREGSAVRAAGGQLVGPRQLRRWPAQRREKAAAEIVETKHGFLSGDARNRHRAALGFTQREG